MEKAKPLHRYLRIFSAINVPLFSNHLNQWEITRDHNDRNFDNLCENVP
jgi:hypothetical protein